VFCHFYLLFLPSNITTMTIQLNELSIMDRMAYLQSAIAPRPIALASTIDAAGNVNVSPFSFFNLFSSNPPIVIFSPARRGRDNTTKHTLQNVLEVPEVVINIVDYDMVQQTSLSSCEYPQGVNEFDKAGFTPIPSLHIKPPRVAQSKIQLECKVNEVKSLGNEGGAGQLVIAEVLCMHIDDSIITNNKIDQTKLTHVARLGSDWYCKVDATNLFEVPKPNVHLGIGIDSLPQSIKESNILTGNDLAMLANVTEQPQVLPSFTDDTLKNIVQYYNLNPAEMENEMHIYAKQLLNKNNVDAAWQVLLASL
jgi:flavin reductase (DIM6/NTAB) family NADH-FMN oxidoreductase RutF